MNADDVLETLPEDLDDVEFEDRLSVVATAAGAFLVLAGLGTVAGAPWAHKVSLAPAVVQVLGALGTAAVGLGLVWLGQFQG